MTAPGPIATLHARMTRQGPGEPADVHWALDRLSLPDRPRICDAGCGPGADLDTLAQALPGAAIHGVEMMPHLADEARARCADFANVTVETGDMAALSGPFDLIWCAGAIYFLGITPALHGWCTALAPDGAVAFSEPVLAADAPGAARAFWADYPAITDLDGIFARVRAAGYEVLDHRRLTGAAWAGFYAELADRVAALRPGAGGDLAELLESTAREIALWHAAPEAIAYTLVLARPAPAA